MRKSVRILTLVLVLGFFLINGVAYAQVVLSLDPNTLNAVLRPGESVSETKEVYYDAYGPHWVTLLGTLSLKTSEGYEDWLTYVDPQDWADAYIPGIYTDPEELGTNPLPLSFEITITVPLGTPPGTYSFGITAYASEIDMQAGQMVTITVPPEPVIPEFPLGTITGIVAMLAAFGVFMIKRFM